MHSNETSGNALKRLQRLEASWSAFDSSGSVLKRPKHTCDALKDHEVWWTWTCRPVLAMNWTQTSQNTSPMSCDCWAFRSSQSPPNTTPSVFDRVAASTYILHCNKDMVGIPAGAISRPSQSERPPARPSVRASESTRLFVRVNPSVRPLVHPRTPPKKLHRRLCSLTVLV